MKRTSSTLFGSHSLKGNQFWSIGYWSTLIRPNEETDVQVQVKLNSRTHQSNHKCNKAPGPKDFPLSCKYTITSSRSLKAQHKCKLRFATRQDHKTNLQRFRQMATFLVWCSVSETDKHCERFKHASLSKAGEAEVEKAIGWYTKDKPLKDGTLHSVWDEHYQGFRQE